MAGRGSPIARPARLAGAMQIKRQAFNAVRFVVAELQTGSLELAFAAIRA